MREGRSCAQTWLICRKWSKNDVSISKWRKPKCVNTWAFWDLMLWTASKSSPARLIDSDNIRQIVSTIWVYMQAEQLELFNPNRLPQAPYCTRGKGEAVVIGTLTVSVTKSPHQINLPVLTWWLVFDIDHPQAAVAWQDAGLPPPNWVAVNPSNGHAHMVYGLSIPVKTADPEHIKALRYFAAVYDAMAVALKSRLKLQRTADKKPNTRKMAHRVGLQRSIRAFRACEYVDLTQAQKRAERF